MVKFPRFEIVIAFGDNTPAVNAALVPPPAVNVPVEVTFTVPVNVFTPLLHVLLFASLAVIFILKESPAICVPIFPPLSSSIRKLLTTPGST